MRQLLFTNDAVRQFKKLSPAVKVVIREAIKVHLIEADPTRTTRNKFRLRRPSQYADYELRARSWRIFYRIDGQQVIVTLLGEKKLERLVVDGEEIEL